MSVSLTLVLVVLAAGLIGYPFLGFRRPPREEADNESGATGPTIVGELKSDFEAGILSKTEYDELAGSAGEVKEPASAAMASPESTGDEIERRVLELRARSRAAPPSARREQPASPGGKCPQCGEGYRPGDRFCRRCGTRLASGGKR